MSRVRSRGGFLLLETLLGVAIFAIAMLALAKCVQQCMQAQDVCWQDERVRLALSNRMAEIEAGAVFFEKTQDEKLTGLFEGISLRQTRQPAGLQTDQKTELRGLYRIQLEAVWKDGSKAITFYVYQP